jgi:hypothetical protein
LEEQAPELRPASSQKAAFILKTKPLQIEARVEVTPRGLLAIAALVSGILLATAAVVRSATGRR